mgnify:CR=1 FL=1
MQTTGNKLIKLGKPSLIFGWGQQKRFDLVKHHVELEHKRILDIGCGIGIYSEKFFKEGAEVYGIDIDPENIEKAKKIFPGIHFEIAQAEKLPFKDNFFDVVFLHEVLEHVEDDKKAISEALRVLKPGGKIIIFVPNRLFPFETHGIYIGRKYLFGNIPFINWLPTKIRNIFCPHVRVYSVKVLKKLFEREKVDFEVISFVFPAFDKIERKLPVLGKIFKKISIFFEKNSILRRFGISIFMIVKKKDS